MRILDTHQHFWKYDEQRHSWIDDTMSVLKKDYLPEELGMLYKEVEVDGCIAVQADQSIDETDFLLGLADEYDYIKGVVGWLNLRSEELVSHLDRYKGSFKLKGFRHVLQDEGDDEYILDEAFQRGLSTIADHGYSYDLLIYPRQLGAAVKAVRAHPNLSFVLDHIAKPVIRQGTITGWKEGIAQLAEYTNVSCKISGMITEADWAGWTYTDFVPYLDHIVESFGVERIMFGSDWPVCLIAGKYTEVKGIISKYFSNFSEEDKSKLWYQNGAQFYNID